ncbi:MAG: hypothetical protein AB4290_27705 [Spirulina sp.]
MPKLLSKFVRWLVTFGCLLSLYSLTALGCSAAPNNTHQILGDNPLGDTILLPNAAIAAAIPEEIQDVRLVAAYSPNNPEDPLQPEIVGRIPVEVKGLNSQQSPVEARPFFDQFSWQSFIALNWPARAGDRGKPEQPDNPDIFLSQSQGARSVVWGTYREAFDLFSQPQDVRPLSWNSHKAGNNIVCKNAKPGQKVFTMASKVGTVLDATDQAFSFPLIDQNKNFASYEVRFDKAQYNFVRGKNDDPGSWLYVQKNLVNAEYNAGSKGLQMPASTANPRKLGAMMLKAAWREMIPGQDDFNRYYVVDAQVYDPKTHTCQDKQMGLVGFHVVQKLADFPEWIWSTFEQVDNVPIPGVVSSTPLSFNNGTPFPKTIGGYANKPQYKASKMPPRDKRVPVQVTRLNPIPTTPAGASTQDINRRYQKALEGTVWQNYELVFTQWPSDPASFLLMEGGGVYPQDSGGAFPVNGITNTVMETYFQSQDDAAGAGGNSCMSCHYRAGQSDFSWVLQLRAH